MKQKNEDEAFEQLKCYYMPVSLTNIKSLIKKFGDDISDDFVFFTLVWAVHHENDKRHMNGDYDADFREISEKMKAVEKSYGLKEDEYFPLSDAPKEYKELNDVYTSISDKKLVQVFDEYKLHEFSSFYKNNKEAFNKRFESVRSSFFEDDPKERGGALKKIISDLENEVTQCISIKAYNASVLLLSSAIEAVLLEGCMSSDRFMAEFVKFNNNRKKDKKKSLTELNLWELINLANDAQIYPFGDGGEIDKKFLLLAKDIRNLIHPGRRLAARIHAFTLDEVNFLFGMFNQLKNHYIDSGQSGRGK